MAELPLDHLTEPELGVIQKHLTTIGQLQALAETRQEAVNDIVGLALEARGLSPTTHTIEMPQGLIKPKLVA